MYIDTHTHLYYKEIISQLDVILNRAKINHISKIICVGTNLETSKKCVDLSEKYDLIFGSVGIHPQDCTSLDEDYINKIEYLSKHKKIVAIGEIGLDYYRDYNPKKNQRDVFLTQLQLAQKLKLPSIIHCRDSQLDVFDIINEVKNYNVVFHCYSYDLEFAKKIISKGCLISFTGNITFGNKYIESVINEIELSKIMLETDCPFLSPVPNRGKLNEPSNIPHIAKKIAEIKKISLKEVCITTTKNAETFFKI